RAGREAAALGARECGAARGGSTLRRAARPRSARDEACRAPRQRAGLASLCSPGTPARRRPPEPPRRRYRRRRALPGADPPPGRLPPPRPPTRGLPGGGGGRGPGALPPALPRDHPRAAGAGGRRAHQRARLTMPRDPSVFVHEKGLCESDDVGPRTRIWAFAHVMRGAVVGADCNIGDHAFIETGARVGDRVTVKNNALVWDKVTLEDDVFVGPNAVFTNDLIPRNAFKNPPERF